MANKKQHREDGDGQAPVTVLPCVGTGASSNYFAELSAAPGIDLLPIALPSTLDYRIQADQPDAVVIAAEEFPAARSKNMNQLAELFSVTPAILLTEQVNASVKKAALRLNIHSLLPLSIHAHQLIAAITAVAAGLAVAIRPAEEERDDWSLQTQEDPVYVEHLTSREIEVLRWMAGGYGNKEIADRLHISEHTAKFHVSSVLAKLGAASRTEAVTIGITRGLVAI